MSLADWQLCRICGKASFFFIALQFIRYMNINHINYVKAPEKGGETRMFLQTTEEK